jgi:murein DD-endopeptidase MepM/ murein hydrolase activator NlpD
MAVLYAGVVLLLVLVAGGALLWSQSFSRRVSQIELERLSAENAKLTKKYEQMRWNLTEVESRYRELVKKEVAIRSLFALPEIKMGERELGVGGPPPPTYRVMSEAEQTAYHTESELDRLLKLSELELDSYEEVEESLLELKDRLQHTPSIWPTEGWISRGYGMRYDPFTGYKQMHHGIDIANNVGTPVMATAEGTVKWVGRNGGLGRMVTIDHGYGFQTRYGHLSEIMVRQGQQVERGEVIGLMGNTGYSTGPHLHYEVLRNNRSLNPKDYILNSK